jgi:hypothetical protein
MSSSHPLIADMGIYKPEDVPYFADLGLLFVVHARAEAAMHILARKLDPGAPDFSKERIKMLTARIRKTVGAAESADVNECLTQLKLISTERDKFAHRFVEYFSGKLQVSNEFSSKQFEKERVHHTDAVRHDDGLRAHLHQAAACCGNNMATPRRNTRAAPRPVAVHP